MDVPCRSCGADLRLNPKLADASVSCPRCGAKVSVPAAPRPARKRLELEPDPPPPPPPRKLKLPMRFTLWLLAAQVTLAVLGLSCLAGAFYRERWGPPAWSYFQAPPMILVPVGIGLVAAGWLAHYLPVLTTLFVALSVLGAGALAYLRSGHVDASRALALALAMLALWLALQHRRANAR